MYKLVSSKLIGCTYTKFICFLATAKVVVTSSPQRTFQTLSFFKFCHTTTYILKWIQTKTWLYWVLCYCKSKSESY
uniref:Uncharacterized protein n=1 Tax=Arundo donax TaxID=35708 RepID=A0A0A9ATC8_ARUDO